MAIKMYQVLGYVIKVLEEIKLNYFSNSKT